MEKIKQKIYKWILNLWKPMDKTLKEIKTIEFEKINYHKLSDDYFEVIKGKIPILISAPHGAKHLRNGFWKEEDEYTASIAIKLAELTGAHVIYVKNATNKDSNWDKNTKYKKAIKELVDKLDIKFVVDIHGASADKDFRVDVGIIDKKNMKKCSCRKYKDIIEESLKEIKELQDGKLFNIIFSGAGNKKEDIETIILFAKDTCKIEAAQFEIRADYRIIDRKPDSSKAKKGTEPDYKADEKNVIEMINTLRKMIEEINAKL